MAELINYEVKIIKHETVIKTTKEYQKVSDNGNKVNDGPVYDYVEVQREAIIDTPIITQVIEGDKVDVKAVLKAINNL